MSYYFKFAIVSKVEPVIITRFFNLSLPSCHDNELVTNVSEYDLTLQHNKSTALELSQMSLFAPNRCFSSQQNKNISFQMNPSLQNLNLVNCMYTFKYKLLYLFLEMEK